MSQRSKEILIYALAVIVIASLPLYFKYHQFYWWSLIGPGIGSILVVIASRRQKRRDDLRSRRENSTGVLSQQKLNDAKADQESAH
jgi:peptidoglycan/LPS O-acetylase OafA/YrhL